MFGNWVALAAAAILAAPARARIEAYPGSFHTQMVATNGTSLFVRVGGQGPAVILPHGFGDTGDMWAPLAAALVKDHTVIVPDLRGMGLSAHPDSGYTKKNQALDIAGVMDALRIKSADLVTYDIGNMVSFGTGMADELRFVADHVDSAIVAHSGHWIMEENPQATLNIVTEFLAK